MSHSSAHRLWTTGKVVLVAAMIGLFANPAEAIDLSGSSGKYTLNLDVTVSWGARYRVQDIDTAIISPFEGGTAWSVNGDDGNLNYDDGDAFSSLAKITSDLELTYENFGLFLRGSAFYDSENEDGDRDRTDDLGRGDEVAPAEVRHRAQAAHDRLDLGQLRHRLRHPHPLDEGGEVGWLAEHQEPHAEDLGGEPQGAPHRHQTDGDAQPHLPQRRRRGRGRLLCRH